MDNNLFNSCPYTTAQKLLSGKWSILILYNLSLKTTRFNQLQKSLGNITQTTLTRQLRELESYGLIERIVYPQIPPKVEYKLTELGAKFTKVLDELEVWGNEYLQYYNSKN